MNNIEAFIMRGVDTTIRLKDLRHTSLTFLILNFFQFFYSDNLGNIYFIITILLTVSNLVSLIVFYKKIKILNLETFYIITGTQSIEGMLNFSYLAFLVSSYLKVDTITEIWMKLLIIFIPILISMVYIIIQIKSINKKNHTNKKSLKFKNVKTSAIIGGVIGMFIAKSFLSNIDKTTAIIIGIITTTFISILFSLGLLDFYKLKLLKKIIIEENL